MPKKTRITEKDLETFYEAMKGTKPLTQNKIPLSPPKRPKKSTIKKEMAEEMWLTESNSLPAVGSDALLTYKQNAISNKNLRKLRKGQYNVEAKLDLHGMNVKEAMAAVNHFLHACTEEGKRVVLIIHGKGHHSESPILKNKLNHWLRECEIVLAFSSAGPQHGSGGAVYVLLKRL